MSEIHRGTGQTVYLDVYGGTADALPTATLVGTDGASRALAVTQDTAPSGIDERYYVTLSMADTQNEGELSVTWSFTMDAVPVERVDDFSVVTPYLSISEVKKIYTGATDEEAIELEAAVRHIINAHTGQSFGYSTKTVTVHGHGELALKLPERIIEVTGLSTLTAVLDPNVVIIAGDGWYLKKGWSVELSAIDSDSIYWQGWETNNNVAEGNPGYEKTHHGHVIVAPGGGGVATRWRDDYPFTITGVWGYKNVPVPVKEAAKLLVNDYACTESLYRDRYLKSIRAADWRFEFSSLAWDRTGNVRADQLLAEYVILDWGIV